MKKQKLVTLHLRQVVGQDGKPQEQLKELFENGWKVDSITPLGASDDALIVWFAVVLEKEKD